jgi:hypothetical protein
MATDAVPARASGGSIAQAGWFRFVVRAAIALLAFWTLSFAADRYIAPRRRTEQVRRFAVAFLRRRDGCCGRTLRVGELAALHQGSVLAEPPSVGCRCARTTRPFLVGLDPWSPVGRTIRAALLVRLESDPVRVGCPAGVAIASGFRAKRSGSDTA